MHFSSRFVAVAFVAGCAFIPAISGAATPADQAGDLAAFVHGALAAAPTNFTSVRGNRTETSKFAALVNFGPTFQTCSVVDETSNALETGGTSAWSLDCESLPIDSPAAPLLDQLKDQLSGSVPASLTLSTYKDDNGLTHLRWSGPGGISVDAFVWSTPADKMSHFRVSAIHLVGGGLPTQATTEPPA